MTRSMIIAVLGMMFAIPSLAQENKVPRISTEELEKLLEKKENLYFLDVREPKEIEELGTVEGYVNIPLGRLESRLSEIPKSKLIVTL